MQVLSKDIYRNTMQQVTGIKFEEDESINPCCSWYHMVIGYDAGYFGYGWSDVYALDCFAQFQFSEAEAGVDRERGKQLRESVLAPCASRPANKLMLDFLGRERVNLEGFLEQFKE